MQILSFIFQKTKVLFFILILLYSSLIISCKTEDIWEYKIENVREKLSNSDFNFLYLIDYENYSSKEILKLGEEAPFYFYFIFKRLYLDEKSLDMLYLMHRGGDGIYADEAVSILMETLLEYEEYQEVENAALSYLWRMPDSNYKYDIRKAYIEALYWQKKDNQVINSIDSLFNELGINIETFNKQNNTNTSLSYYELSELILFRAVSLARLDNPEWKDMFEYLYINQSISDLHIRAYQYLTIIEPNRIYSFENRMQLLFKGKYLISIGDRENGIPILESALVLIEPEILDNSPLIKEIGFAYLNLEESLSGALYLDDISKRLTGVKKLEAVEMAGRIYNNLEDYDKAYDRLNTVANNSLIQLQKNRCLWFIFEMRINESAETGLFEIISNFNKWSDIDYFSDLIHELITVLTKDTDYENLMALYTFLKENIDDSYDFLLRAEYILIRTGQLDTSGDALNSYLENINPDTSTSRYYYFLISFLNNSLKANVNKLLTSINEIKTTEEDYSIYDTLISDFFYYGIPESGFEYTKKFVDKINLNTLYDAAKVLNEKEYYIESIILINYYFNRKSGLPEYEELKISYPWVYVTQIEELSKRDSLSIPVINGVIRSESGFDLDIVSSAGAVGLMQLMPDTAEDVAGMLGIGEIDLTNPYQNLALGTRYFRYLNSRFDNLSESVMAYNAGPGNMRKWESEFINYSSDIVPELIPFKGTRRYVINVLTSAIIYSVLYQSGDPDEILLQFYPDLK